MCCVLPNVSNENLEINGKSGPEWKVSAPILYLTAKGRVRILAFCCRLVFQLVTLPVILRFPELRVEGHICALLELKHAP